MLVGTSKAVAQRLAATSNSSRSFACTAAPLSSSLSSQTTQPAQPDRPRADPHRRLVDRIVRLAVRGSQELDQRLEDPSRNQSSTVQAGYKPTPRRQTPPQPLPWIGTGQIRAKQRRGKLVAYQVDRRNGSQLAQAAQSRSVSARRDSAVSAGDLAARDNSVTRRRSFSSSSASHLRLDEASLAVNDDTVDGGGLWDDAEAGENFKSGKKGKARELRPGDWVDTSRAGQQLCGIYICRSFATVRRGTILASSGEVVDVSMDDIISVVPSVVAARLATQLGDHLEASITAARASNNAGADVEAANSPMVASDRPETLEILQALRQVEIDIERETQLLAANGVHDIYRIILAAAAPAAPTSVTVSSALSALRVPNKSSRARSLALTRILLAQPQHFIADPLTLRQTGRFDLRPLEEVERFELAREWVRERSPEVEAWAEKCARVRQWGRDQQAASSSSSEVDVNSDGAAALPLRPLPANDPDFSWSESDLVLFGFLRDTLARERLLQMQPHLAIAPSLIKLVDATTGRLGLPAWEQTREVQRPRIRDFLAEVGIVAEWEAWVAHEAPKGLRSWDEIGDKVAAKLARARERSSSPAPSSTPSPTDFYPLDPHDSVRHDFGSATVFTIDDPSASELDDGISIAAGPPTANGTATWWVHVHIADPTALLHPNHLLTNLARLRDHTVYFPEYTWSMLPDTFTVEQKLSLGSNGQAGQRVLSLGMRIDEASGEVVESEVKAGIVRDVRRLTYGAVEKVLGYEAPQSGRTISNRDLTDAELEAEANRARRPTDDAALRSDTASLDQLSTLHRLAKKMMRRRVESSALFWQFPSSSVSVSPKPIRPHFETLENPLFHSRPPRVSVRLPSEGDHSYVDSPANLLVSEMMVAANRVAARFAVERGIAVPFRQQGAPTALPEDLDAVLKLRDPDSGIAPAREVLKRRIEFLPGETTPTPGPHWPMGINDEYGYLRVTSPLRRYSDLFSHYQLKGALLPESSMAAFAPRAGLPAVLTQIEGFNAAAKARHRLDGAAQSYWSLWVIKQKVDLLNAMSNSTNSAPSAVSDEDHKTFDLLANGLTALAYRQPVRSTFENLYVQSVLIPQLGVRGALRLEKPEHGPEIGEEVPVKVEDIALGPRSRIVVSLRR